MVCPNLSQVMSFSGLVQYKNTSETWSRFENWPHTKLYINTTFTQTYSGSQHNLSWGHVCLPYYHGSRSEYNIGPWHYGDVIYNYRLLMRSIHGLSTCDKILTDVDIFLVLMKPFVGRNQNSYIIN